MSASDLTPHITPVTPTPSPDAPSHAGGGPPRTRHQLDSTERTGSGAAGALLLAWATGRQGMLAKLAMVGGIALLWRAATGRCAVKQALQPTPYERDVAQSRHWSAATVVNDAVTINRPRDEIYRFWRDFSNLPQFMTHIEQVDIINAHRSRWTVSAPLGRTVQWISYVLEDTENEHISWEAEAQADIPNAGWVAFRDAPEGAGTEVRVQICYQPPYGHAGRLASRFMTLETPSSQLAHDLRRLKQVLESQDSTADGPPPEP